MRPAFRTACSAISLVIAALLVAPPVAAKTAQAPAKAAAPAAKDDAWLYRGSDVPRDREWTFGELPNGLRYAVRRNGVPPGQVSIRVRIDAGALYENDNEKGYAHLLEHMVFRQSKYLGDGEAIPAFQRLGATFGSDTNATTGPVSTTFKLDLPGATPQSLTESFRLLSGMMIAPTLSEANVRTDVPIVLAEKRDNAGPGERIAETTQQTLFAGQRLAERPVIGTTETLTAAHQASVRAFHARWYRPENAVIIVAGDADPAQMAGLIKTWFGSWKGTGKATPAPSFGDPVAPSGGAGGIGETRVIVEADVPRNLTYAVLRPWRKVDDTIAYNQGIMIDSLAQAIINRRLEARARGGGSYLTAQVQQDKISRSANATFVTVTPLAEDWKTALADVRGVLADAMASAPSQEEIDREVAEMNVAFESSMEQSRLQPGSRLADDIVAALDIRETVASPETVLSIFNSSKPLFTPAAVLQHTRDLFKGVVTRGVYVTPRSGEADSAAFRSALAAPVKADGKARLDTKPISFAGLPAIGAPGKVVVAAPTVVPEIEQVELSNGIKALLFPTGNEPGRLSVKVRFGAGYRAFQPGDAAYIQLGEMALVGSGVGTLGQEELDRISTGRKMGFDFDIDDTNFKFQADTRNADLADQLYLFAAKFAMPKWDANPVLRAKAASKLQYESMATSPQGVVQRDLAFLQHGRDPRFRTPTPQEMDAATPAGFRQVWEPILRDGPIEVQLFGDFDRDAAIAALERTFGALPRRPDLPRAVATATFPETRPSDQPIVLEHRGDASQAAAVVQWPTAGGMVQLQEGRQLEILSQLFSNRLLDRLREKLGEAYSPQVYNSWPRDRDTGGAIIALAQLQPKAVPIFFATADEIAHELVAAPPSADELARVTEPLKQQLARAATASAFFMGQLEGATDDPRRFSALGTLLPDMTRTTPAAMQALAAKYLTRGNSWRVAVIPAGQSLATQVPAGVAAGVRR
ncbi:zinc protease [Novosphingobium kunmingense]|uniref:Zinc protease n=1 Tax=Novosphingobium kunmingense TaxID=1211806 RepID=A0A2N0I406_9SPHN|nr:M16 family metallopeptidase [Novosphingobium kunmingense]PKB25911.1 zinc protease [Novosphingobium kunmingense]